MRGEHDRYERHRRRRNRPFQHGHLQHERPHALRVLRRGEQAHVGPERQATEHRAAGAELVEQGEHLRRVAVDPVLRGVRGLVTAPVPEQIEQHHTVALLGERARDPTVQVRIQQQPVRVHEQPLSLAVGVEDQLVTPVDEAIGPVLLNHCDSFPDGRLRRVSARAPPGATRGAVFVSRTAS